MNCMRCSRLNMYFFSALLPMAMISSSKRVTPLCMISECPKVKGSKDPGKIARLIGSFSGCRLQGNISNLPIFFQSLIYGASEAVSYTHLRAHETDSYLVCRLL